jgi:glycosyltransferase involved in cell wall biosynthesis
MTRPIAFDLTHLLHRAAAPSPSGIDRVDLAFGRYFARHAEREVAAVHYGRRNPIVLPPARLGEVVRTLDERWKEDAPADQDPALARARAWLGGREPPARRDAGSTVARTPLRRPREPVWTLPWRPAAEVPREALYLNIAQHALERREGFGWMDRRPDVERVFFVHDLIPLDHPEFWWGGHERIFEARVRVIARHATAVITSTQAVRQRVIEELARRGRPAIPVLARHLPSPIGDDEAGDARDPGLADQTYFVMISTIEPRKNHLLLFNVWRHLAAGAGTPPKLILIGKRGWNSQQAIDMLERCAPVAAHVLELASVSNAAMRKLVANARALLMPSFAEGYGLPIVEALTLKTPVVAADIEVFREVTQGRAIFRDPVDGLGWAEAIAALSTPQSSLATQARAAAAAFAPPSERDYFEAVEAFLASL